ncbi:MAG: hypothetical protein MUC92_12685 [Fimbriimonadaceae bacterium]|jgi:hypothetical protein|nr:hypothetical protein [Fimbriimonadaceae bacterium]
MRNSVLTFTTLFITFALIGCENPDTSGPRPQDPAQIEKAKDARCAEIDTLNIPADQKERMKQQLGCGGITATPPPGRPSTPN